ncbi:MAG: hypothetical protein WC505_07540 [Patescibacteria group bacterium]
MKTAPRDIWGFTDVDRVNWRLEVQPSVPKDNIAVISPINPSSDCEEMVLSRGTAEALAKRLQMFANTGHVIPPREMPPIDWAKELKRYKLTPTGYADPDGANVPVFQITPPGELLSVTIDEVACRRFFTPELGKLPLAWIVWQKWHYGILTNLEHLVSYRFYLCADKAGNPIVDTRWRHDVLVFQPFTTLTAAVKRLKQLMKPA